ncbi:MAG TPA: DUF4156 domain-containing protein [Kofleriaceae bacterium]|nr:DUF4156 domain-containing protein [Kofleriaceae bacterium]
MLASVTALGALGALGGCAGFREKRVALRPEASHVELMTGRPDGCQALGDVIGSATVEGDKEQAIQEARNDVRNKAAALGATHIELQTTSNERKSGMWHAQYEITLSGVAYRCAR